MIGVSELQTKRGGRIDFHTHILPDVDDGSRSVEQSLQMIRALADQGVDSVVLTPHFYPQRDNPERFVARREKAYGALCEAVLSSSDISHVKLIPGAEIEYFDGLASMAEYPELKLGESACLLIEMTPDVWSSHMVDDLLELNSRHGCRVVIAHVERYLFEQRRHVLYELLDNGIVMQSNAEFFINRRSANRAIKLLNKGFIHLLGSDSHNLTDRAPNIGEACDVIKKRLGDDVLDIMMNRAYGLLTLE